MSNKRSSSDTDFTNVTFDEIKQKLVNRAKTYYPDTYKDFNSTSFGSLMFDLVSMVGEQLNFYAQFIANENFLETSRTVQGLTSAARDHGIEIFNKYTSVGKVKIHSRIPANSSLSGPDSLYRHTILKGATITSDEGASFTTTEDVHINTDNENMIGTEFSSDGSKVTYYVYESEVPVVSGELRTISVEVGSYQKFLKVEIRDSSITEVVSVFDANGNEYYQVQNLSQNVVYRELKDRQNMDNRAKSKMVPFPVPRRFTIRHEGEKTFLVFGFGSESTLKVKEVADPSEIVFDIEGKNYITDNSFDPSKILSTDKFGVSPQNTELTISYRSNTTENSNAASKSLNRIISSEIFFSEESSLTDSKVQYIRNTISCFNEEPINGALTYTSTQEISETIKSAAGALGRAVTAQDYIAACYAMPSKFGSIKRASLHRDMNDYRRNLNLHVISQNALGQLQIPSSTLKNNLKKWLNSVRMITDTIDIFDAKILNLAIYFDVVISSNADKTTALSNIRKELYSELTMTVPQIGEDFSIGMVEKILSSISMISRINSIKISSRTGTGYSDNRYQVKRNISPDGSLAYMPEDFIWELKNEEDITGRIQ
jgi:hypothetical protein